MLGVRLCSTWEAVADKKITNLTAISLFHLHSLVLPQPGREFRSALVLSC